MHELIVVVPLACDLRQVLVLLLQLVGQEELTAPCTVHPNIPGVTSVLGCTTGSPPLSVCFGSLYNW